MTLRLEDKQAIVAEVGEVAKTTDPLPVSSVKAVAIFAEVNEPKEIGRAHV